MTINLTDQQLETIVEACKNKSDFEKNKILKEFAQEYAINYVVLKRHYYGTKLSYVKRNKQYITDYSTSPLHQKRIEDIRNTYDIESLPEAIDVSFDNDLNGSIDVDLKDIKPSELSNLVKLGLLIIVVSVVLSIIFIIF